MHNILCPYNTYSDTSVSNNSRTFEEMFSGFSGDDRLILKTSTDLSKYLLRVP